jgi:hypothetical protein
LTSNIRFNRAGATAGAEGTEVHAHGVERRFVDRAESRFD